MADDPVVLVVDVDREVATRTARTLDGDGYETTVVAGSDVDTGSLDAGLDERPACVVTEVEVGEFPGLEFAAAIRDRDARVGLVIHTDSGDETLASRALSLGVDEYVPKDASDERFVAAVGRAVADQQSGGDDDHLLDAIVAATPDGTILTDRDGRVRRVDERAATLLETDRDRLEGRRLTDAVPSFEADESSAVTESEVSTDGVADLVTDELFHDVSVDRRSVTDARVTIVGPDRTRHLSVSGRPLHGPPLEGGAAFTLRDRTASVSRLRRLERYRTIVESVGDMVYRLDREGRVEVANRTFARYFGQTVEEIVGTDVADLLPDPAYEAGAQLIRDLVADDELDRGRYEFRMDATDGSERHLENNLAVIVEDGHYRGSVGIIRDVTDRVNQERRLERQNDRLEEFASIVGHDLRNPLNVIDGRLELLRETDDESHIDHMESAIDRIDELLSDLLRLAQEGKAVDDVRPVSIDGVAVEAWRSVETTGGRLVLAENLGTVEADRGRLRQAFENLFRNAIDHGIDGGVDPEASDEALLTVTVEPLGNGFAVRDDGAGIDADAANDVFTRGFTTCPDGTGFGLSIVERIVDAHGWQIYVDTDYEDGARFVVQTGPDA